MEKSLPRSVFEREIVVRSDPQECWRTITDVPQLVSWVNRYLDDPSLYRAQREAIVREWVQFTDGLSGQRLGDAILRGAHLEPPTNLTASAVAQRESQCASR